MNYSSDLWLFEGYCHKGRNWHVNRAVVLIAGQVLKARLEVTGGD